jgi:F-type H+-transporting ATPase subunit epsilon
MNILEIITPNSIIKVDDCNLVTLPTTEGEIGILPNHIALVSSLSDGFIKYESNKIYIKGGFLQVQDNKISVLAEFALMVNDENIREFKEDIKDLEEKYSKNQEEPSASDLENKKNILQLIEANL